MHVSIKNFDNIWIRIRDLSVLTPESAGCSFFFVVLKIHSLHFVIS